MLHTVLQCMYAAYVDLADVCSTAALQMNEREAREWDRKLLSNANARPTYPTADSYGQELPQYPGQRESERVPQEPRRDATRGQRDYDGNWR